MYITFKKKHFESNIRFCIIIYYVHRQTIILLKDPIPLVNKNTSKLLSNKEDIIISRNPKSFHRQLDSKDSNRIKKSPEKKDLLTFEKRQNRPSTIDLFVVSPYRFCVFLPLLRRNISFAMLVSYQCRLEVADRLFVRRSVIRGRSV